MKNILVPTDFSINAEHAIEYAMELNKKLQGKILLFHFYTIPVYATDIPMAIPSDYELKRDSIIALNKLKSKLGKEHPGTEVSCEVVQGFTMEKIVQEEKTSKVDLVVMGTRGAGGLKELLIGSNTADVISKSICPVIAVPEGAVWKGLNKIVFAANYADDDFKNVFDIVNFARLFNSEVILLHIDEGMHVKAFEYSQLECFAEQVKEETEYPKISFKLFEDRDVFEGLNLYLEEVNADMLAITKRDRSFARKLFSRSLTKRMAYHTNIPLMAFHSEE